MGNKRILVTGGFGFIGSHLVEHLVGKGIKLALAPSRHAPPDYPFYNDVQVLDITKASVEWFDLDYVFHFAAEVGVTFATKQPKKAFNNNIQVTLSLLEWLRKQDSNATVVFASTDRVYGKPTAKNVTEEHPTFASEAYSASKIASEALLEAYQKTYGINYVITRVANTYGPRQSPTLFIPSIISRILKGSDLSVGNLAVSRNFIYVGDIIDAYLKIMERGILNEILNLSHSQANLKVVVDKLVSLGEAALAHKIKVVEDRSLFRPSGTEIAPFCLDSSKARSLLEWEPKHDLDTGLAKTFKWYVDP